MNRFLNVFVLTRFILNTVELEPSTDYGMIPERCQARPHIMNRHCCIFPPFFTFEIAQACGAHSARIFVLPGTNITGLKRMMSNRNCDHWECMLNKYHLINPKGFVNDEKFYLHLDKWADLNPPFSEVMLGAKLHCKTAYRLSMPLTVCEFFDFLKCVRNHINLNCPVVIQTKDCLEQKEFYDDCKEYYYK